MTTPDVEVLIVGAGVSGIGAGIELLRRGHRRFGKAIRDLLGQRARSDVSAGREASAFAFPLRLSPC